MAETSENTILHNIFDSHAHYTDPVYTVLLDDMLDNVRNAGVGGILLPSTTLSDSEAACRLAEQYPFLYAAIGVHPLYLNIPGHAYDDPVETHISSVRSHDDSTKVCNSSVNTSDDLSLINDSSYFVDPKQSTAQTSVTDRLRVLAMKYHVNAIGEIGLDLRFRKNDPAVIRMQKRFFDDQLSLCEELHLPALLHSVDATADTMDLIKSHRNVCGVLHGFSGSVETAKQYLYLGWYIGIGTTVLRPEARRIRDVVRMLPADRILLESDCPYQPKTKKSEAPSDSSVLISVLNEIAEIRNEDPQNLCDLIFQNSLRLFSIS